MTKYRNLRIKENCTVDFPIDIQKNNSIKMGLVMFKMDTGSTISTISKEELRKLGYDDKCIKENARKDELPPSTADRKKVSAYYVQLPILNLIGFEAKE